MKYELRMEYKRSSDSIYMQIKVKQYMHLLILIDIYFIGWCVVANFEADYSQP